jgi:neutral ceramidase
MCLPGEFTTMSGRRLRNAVHTTLSPTLGPNTKVVLSTICNTYSSYVATQEEYQIQRYEGASTLYGPHTLDAYIETAVALAQAMVDGRPVQSTAAPEQFETRLLSFLPPVLLDTAPKGKAFGDVLKQPDASYTPGQTVEVVFQSANPRNNLRRYQTFLEVQLYNSSSDAWTVVHTDDDWCTKFIWDRPKGPLSSESTAAVHWEVPGEVVHGKYRIRHYGDAKSLSGRVAAFEGTSQEFLAGSDRESGK